jgi:hypothetical protein
MSEEDKVIDAETVPTQAVAKREDVGLTTISAMEHSFALAVRQRELLSEYIKQQLKPGKHFYQRGDQKPSLSKEGAEIILLPHNLAPDYELVSGPESPPEGDQPYQITVKCILRRKGDPGSFVGSGMGSAGSHKGYWKRAKNKPDEWLYQPRQTDKFLCHNATLKMAQKSAMIAATINSTAASEFFTQDLEGEPPPPPKPQPVAKPKPQPPKEATEKTKEWFIKAIGDARDACAFCIELGWIMPNEGLNDIPLRFVPTSTKQLEAFKECLGLWIKEGKVNNPYLPAAHGDTNVPPGEPEASDAKSEVWYDYIVPIPHKGQKRADYVGNEDTIGSLYEARHDDEEARRRLWGFCTNYEPKGWVKNNGTQMPPSKTDIEFRAMLDAFQSWFEKNHPEDKL